MVQDYRVREQKGSWFRVSCCLQSYRTALLHAIGRGFPMLKVTAPPASVGAFPLEYKVARGVSQTFGARTTPQVLL